MRVRFPRRRVSVVAAFALLACRSNQQVVKSDQLVPEASPPPRSAPEDTAASASESRPSPVLAATSALPAERQTIWNPGLNAVGGIPYRTTIYKTLAPSGGDDTAAIQAALDACPPEQVVMLRPGTFHITGEGLFMTRSGVTLRGSGPGKTRLEKARADYGLIIMGERWYKYTQPVRLAADARRGTYSMTLVSNPGWEPGEIVSLDQLSDPALTVWSKKSPPGDPSRGWFHRFDRPIGQVMEIQTVKGNTITFTTPFHIDFLTRNKAELLRFSQFPDGPMVPAVKRAGVEDLTLAGGSGGDGGGNVHFFATAYSWARNIEATESTGNSVNFDGSFRCVLRDSYIHSTQDPNPGGGGYGIGVNDHAADNLIENNISWNFNKVMVMRAAGGGNVIGYNYMEDGWGYGYPNFPESGLNASHMTTSHYELFEGNQSFNFDGEPTWGNAIYITVLRNHLTGKRRSVAPLKLADLANRKAVSLSPGHWWYSFLGNVLGYAGQDPAPAPAFAYEISNFETDPRVPMWKLGYGGDGTPQDVTTVQRTIRHGNFDYVTNKVNWDPAIASREIPASLYLKAKPAFFGSNPWPWVTPENPASPVGVLPARQRFDSMH